VQFGGHKMAAGLTINRDQFAEFKRVIGQYAVNNTTEFNQLKTYRVDMDIEEDDIQHKLIEEIELMRPFGEGNPAPNFVLRAATIINPVWVGNNRAHLKFKTGLSNIEAIAFNRLNMNDYPLQKSSQDLLFELDVNEFRGTRNLQLKIKDFKSSITPDNVKCNDSSSNQLDKALKRTIEELREKRPVLYIYPTYRSLIKHQPILEYFLNKQNLQLLHGHLNIDERLQGENQFSQGLGKVFAVTGSFLQYYQTKFNLPASLHYILRLWPSANADMIPSYAGDRQIDSIGASYNYSMYRSTLPLNSGRALCYANLNRTLTYLRDFYPEVKIEAGLTDMRQRRMVGRRYAFSLSAVRCLGDELGRPVQHPPRPSLARVDEARDLPDDLRDVHPFRSALGVDQVDVLEAHAAQ
jgi:single-stranded-DNA-specific exonuclease